MNRIKNDSIEYKADDTVENLLIRRFVPASPERVFKAWTDATEMQKWWGPKGVRCLSAEVDLRVSGKYKIENGMPDGSVVWISGEFEVIERPHLLAYTWAVETGSPGKERVTVRFEQREQGTEVVLNHERIPTATLRQQHQQGWFACLDGLVEYVAV